MHVLVAVPVDTKGLFCFEDIQIDTMKWRISNSDFKLVC